MQLHQDTDNVTIFGAFAKQIYYVIIFRIVGREINNRGRNRYLPTGRGKEMSCRFVVIPSVNISSIKWG